MAKLSVQLRSLTATSREYAVVHHQAKERQFFLVSIFRGKVIVYRNPQAAYGTLPRRTFESVHDEEFSEAMATGINWLLNDTLQGFMYAGWVQETLINMEEKMSATRESGLYPKAALAL